MTLYDPRREPVEIETRDLDRAVPLRVTFPRVDAPPPVILWSHGAGGDRVHYGPLAEHWSSYGYVVVRTAHSDAGKIPWEDRTIFQDWRARPAEISAVIDALDTLGPAVDRDRVGVGGHSFGASTAMMAGGATLSDRSSLADKRVRAVCVLSGQGVGGTYDERSWDSLTKPMIVITGTNDPGRLGDDFHWRTEPYFRSPSGAKYLVVIEGADHQFGHAIGDYSGRVPRPFNARHIEIVRAATLAFWDAHLRDDPAAREFLAACRLADLAPGELTMESK